MQHCQRPQVAEFQFQTQHITIYESIGNKDNFREKNIFIITDLDRCRCPPTSRVSVLYVA